VNGYVAFITQQNTCINIMHRKTEKFITQLSHATHGERRITQRIIQISANQPA